MSFPLFKITRTRVLVWILFLLLLNWLLLENITQHHRNKKRIMIMKNMNRTQPDMVSQYQELMNCADYTREDPGCSTDESKKYKFLRFADPATDNQQEEPIFCLSSQTSVDNLFWVSEQVKTWSGPISLSVFVPDVDFTIAKLMIQRMKACDSNIESNVDFHFLFPVGMPPVLREFQTESHVNCSDMEEYNAKLIRKFRNAKFVSVISTTKYPQNLLRNIARKECWSKYSFTPDIDMISTPNMHQKFVDFLQRESVNDCEKCAFIIPIYEIEESQSFPLNKMELLKYIEEKTARRFHIRKFSPNQANSKLDKWEVPLPTPLSPGVEVLYNITTYAEFWEPIYVTKTEELPEFDERFVGYGYTRNSQVLEMSVASYSWAVMDSAFLSHRGFQTVSAMSAVRKKQIAANYRKYLVFKKDIKKRYKIGSGDPRFK